MTVESVADVEFGVVGIGEAGCLLAAGESVGSHVPGVDVELALLELHADPLLPQGVDIKLAHPASRNVSASKSPALSASTSACSLVTGAGNRVAQRPTWLTMCASLPPMPRYPCASAMA